MSLNNTPNANRLNIALFGKRNCGKSSLINALTGQEVSLVSNIPGTTTDPVYKAMEIHGLGPCLLIDTPGFDDEGELGQMRIERTKKAIERTDIALLLCEENSMDIHHNFKEELQWWNLLKEKNIPTLLIVNKSDIRKDIQQTAKQIKKLFNEEPLIVSAKNNTGIESIRKGLLAKLPADFGMNSITGELVHEGDVVLLVMPQDIQAPKGRLILPQVQTIRELLDKKCITLCCSTDKMRETLQALAQPPQLIITDSQAFKTVYKQKPAESKLTSFSVLFARYKGDIQYFIESTTAIELLTEDSKVLIAEACTHAPLTEDIGTIKIPQMLRKRFGKNITIDNVSGSNFPDDLTPYSLVIHCGACMFNKKYVMHRVDTAKQQHVPMTNYGVIIAYFNGILNQIEF